MIEKYPKPAVTVDVVIMALRDNELQALLIKRDTEPYRGKWALPGGFVRIDEALDAAARRKLEEETGVSHVYLEQLYTFGDLERDPRGRVISVAYIALVPTPLAVHGGSDTGDAQWWPINSMPPLAFDHTDIVQYAVTRLRYKIEYSAVGFRLMPPEFTLSELQKAYEIVLGEPLDKRNFRRRIMEAEVIEPLDEVRSGEGRPARLYRFRPDAVAEVKARRLFP
ncbi:MAG TPA: NUDIX domain-containing protein [Anaerolineae bacterium]|nr:NUDIX domain-containing protein [Anaerolineae bacterium]